MAVATVVARQGLDDISIAAALLHDAVEDTVVGLEELEREFSAELAGIVDGVTKLDRVHYDSKEEQQAATMRKMIVAIAQDIRVLIIARRSSAQSADHRWHAGIQTGAHRSRDPRGLRPLAHRLGMQEMKMQLEDLSFAALHTRRYAEIDQMVQLRPGA